MCPQRKPCPALDTRRHPRILLHTRKYPWIPILRLANVLAGMKCSREWSLFLWTKMPFVQTAKLCTCLALQFLVDTAWGLGISMEIWTGYNFFQNNSTFPPQSRACFLPCLAFPFLHTRNSQLSSLGKCIIFVTMRKLILNPLSTLQIYAFHRTTSCEPFTKLQLNCNGTLASLLLLKNGQKTLLLKMHFTMMGPEVM